MKNIVIATDGSRASDEAVELGVEIAATERADVVFVHATPSEDLAYSGRLPRPPRLVRKPIDESNVALANAARAAENAGVSFALEQIAGRTVDAILAVADARDADLIVAGSRSRRAIATALLGSTSRELVRRAKRPVLVAKTAKEPVAA